MQPALPTAPWSAGRGRASPRDRRPTRCRWSQPGSVFDLPDLGDYRILRRLGEGGMGAVYLGYDDEQRPPGRPQGPRRRPGQQPELRRPLLPRGQERRAAQPPQHRPHPRRRPGPARPASTTWCWSTWTAPAPSPARPARPAGGRRRGPHRPRRRPGPGARPLAQHRPPRHQAGQHPHHPLRRGQAGRPRPGQAHRRGQPPDRRPAGLRHAVLHALRAGDQRQARRRPQRHLRPGRHALPPASPARCRSPARTTWRSSRRRTQGDFRAGQRAQPRRAAGAGRILARMLAREPRDRYQTASELIVDLERSRPGGAGAELRRPRPGPAGPAGCGPAWRPPAEPTRPDLEVPPQRLD